ncbi:hypothetical protein [Neobacillus mesonae]|uniref:hypothetical protein n=1 Tax=Neobacillus mesonae TaxID=1193713 RepID=UPI002E2420FA|nr:hypothetical protein [Neobacillus mesonae]
MNELQVFSELHKFLNSLGPMEFTLAPKSLTLGYKPIRFAGRRQKFATLYGEKRYNCLILHVDQGNQESKKGKMTQKEIQQLLYFDIQEIRGFALKKNEVYIPFEVIDTKEKIEDLKDFVQEQYMIFIKR